MTDPDQDTTGTPEADRLRGELARARREHGQRVTELALGLDELARDLDRVAASRAWRLGHGVTSLLRRVAGRPGATAGAVETARRRVDRLRSETGVARAPVAAARGPVPGDHGELARAIRAALGPAPALAEAPLVTAVIDGGEAAGRALRERTDYPALELAAAADRAGGTLLLLIGPGVVPLEPGWLSELVGALHADLSAVGPTLVDADGVVLSAGVRFRSEGGEVRPYHVDAGREALPVTSATTAQPAVSAAALLVRREAFELAGGLTPGFGAGGSGVDLALGLAAQGRRVACSARSIVLTTSSAIGLDGEDERRLLAERWGPQLRREHRLARLARDPTWAGGAGPRAGVALPGDPGDELARALEGQGWGVSRIASSGGGELPSDLDYLMTAEDVPHARIDRGLLTVGWIGDRPDRPPRQSWIDRSDVLCAASAKAARRVVHATGRPVTRTEPAADGASPLIAAIQRVEAALSVCIKIAAPSRERAERWGDWAFATALQRELQRRECRCLVQTRDEWDDPEGLGCDVALVLRGRARHPPRPAQFNVLWCISHPDELSEHECEAYDLVAVASPAFASELQKRTSTPVIVLEQATDPRVCFPDPPADDRPGPQLAFVANTRGVRRRVLDDLLPTEYSVGVYGSGWDGLLDPRLLVAEHVPADELRRIYSSGAIVLNDHWDDMREHGFLSNRLFDAVACGALVISDPVDGVEERFGGAVVTYRSREELRSVVSHFVDRPAERAERGAAGRALVLGRDTFAHRVDRLLDSVRETMSATGHRLRVTP